MTDISQTETIVRARILEMYLSEKEAETLQNDTDLVGVLDSLQILRLVIELESVFAIKVSDSDLTLENFGSIAKIAAFISRQLGGATKFEEPLAQAP
ncbi:MAG: acyl carrier protein [Gemmataceae bacterium]|nr:acyl carrier protein [Gemmataceae bacterium]MCI0740155.1 acyl carrier protein [Gemmataceae bacterium]